MPASRQLRRRLKRARTDQDSAAFSVRPTNTPVPKIASTPAHCDRVNAYCNNNQDDNAATSPYDNIKMPTSSGDTYCIIRKINNTEGKNTTVEAKNGTGKTAIKRCVSGNTSPITKAAVPANSSPTEYYINVICRKSASGKRRITTEPKAQAIPAVSPRGSALS